MKTAIAVGASVGLYVGLILGVLWPIPLAALIPFLIAYCVTGGIAGRAMRNR